MPQLERYEEPSKVRVIKKDSMGRDPQTRHAMELNDPKPPRLGEYSQALAQNFAADYANYPKALYRLSLDENGVPNGDLVNPSYPMPYDLAVSLGIAEKGFLRINVTNNSQGHFLVRHPYVSMFVPHGWDWDHPQPIDEAECKRQEAALLAVGWVRHVSELPGLEQAPKAAEIDPFKPLPTRTQPTLENAPPKRRGRPPKQPTV